MAKVPMENRAIGFALPAIACGSPSSSPAPPSTPLIVYTAGDADVNLPTVINILIDTNRVRVAIDDKRVIDTQAPDLVDGGWFGIRADVGSVMLRNLQVGGQTPAMQGLPFVNMNVSFDTKGLEFGPWIRRFVMHVREHMPAADGRASGHVAVSFQVRKDGSIADIAITSPSTIDDLNRAARNTIVELNPLQPLPSEYPEDHASLTITFYFNERSPR